MESLQENTTVIECLGYNKGNHYSVIERGGCISRNHCSAMKSIGLYRERMPQAIMYFISKMYQFPEEILSNRQTDK